MENRSPPRSASPSFVIDSLIMAQGTLCFLWLNPKEGFGLGGEATI